VESKSVLVSNLDNESKRFVIKKLPAISMKAILDCYCEHEGLSEDILIDLLNKSGVEPVDEVEDHHQLARLEEAILDYNLSFFKARKKIRIPTFKNRFTPQDYPNADPFIASIISSGMATYLQLKNELSLEEAFTLWEISTTNKINELKAVES